MRTLIISVLMCTVLVLSNRALPAQEKPKADHPAMMSSSSSHDAAITRIMKYREEGEKKLRENRFQKKEVMLKGENIKESIRQKWSKMDAYYDGGKLVRLQLYPHEGVSERTEEFYVIDDKLVFAFIQDKGPKHEGRDMGEPGKEFYFENGKLIKFEDRSGEKEMHAADEQKMYETRLPYEVEELVDILKTMKK